VETSAHDYQVQYLPEEVDKIIEEEVNVGMLYNSMIFEEHNVKADHLHIFSIAKITEEYQHLF